MRNTLRRGRSHRSQRELSLINTNRCMARSLQPPSRVWKHSKVGTSNGFSGVESIFTGQRFQLLSLPPSHGPQLLGLSSPGHCNLFCKHTRTSWWAASANKSVIRILAPTGVKLVDWYQYSFTRYDVISSADLPSGESFNSNWSAHGSSLDVEHLEAVSWFASFKYLNFSRHGAGSIVRDTQKHKSETPT